MATVLEDHPLEPIKHKEPRKVKKSPPKSSRPKKKQTKARPKKQKKSAVPFLVGLGVIACMAAIFVYVEFFVVKPKPVWPEGHSIYGVDVSHYQKKVDWVQVRQSEVLFAFVKATEGAKLKDKRFQDNWEGAAEAGVIRGAYHFFVPHVSAELQAINFNSTVELSKGDLPPVLDVELRGKKPIKQFRADLKVWLSQVEEKQGVKPIIYTGYKFYKDYLEGHFDNHHLWIAHYKVPKLRLEKSDKVKLAFWQHTDGGYIDGINGIVDCNVFYGSMRDLKEVCIK
ncbi:glycoside hydrolase family 25 protein [Pontibacter harenae]|uniref:glycoside hydrolase family 25 protein n=1 Tax=Pontibacter harenae TaxID=2894083 RepID=UPI001E3F78E8|nr:GH25 family lysozyme [Pontibacter harenae]MCC9167513.1 glycoside hydrolase family 25 protein [Pontibacter harenae]